MRSIKNILFGRFVRSKPYTDTGLRRAIPYEEIKSMAFLVDGSDPIAGRQLLNYIDRYSSEGKKITILGYVKKLPPFEEEIIWLTAKDKNWIGIPKIARFRHFVEKDFDVLINTCMETNRPLEYISTYSKAKLRIGRFDQQKTYAYDFMMQTADDDVYKYLAQVEHYLRMVRTEQ